jgi:hypothetical protein
MADHKIACLTSHISWPESSMSGRQTLPLGDPTIGSTLTSDFAADLLQVQQGEIFDARFDCRFGKAV